MNPYYDPAKPHHTREGFRNNYIDTVSKGFGELVRWQIERRQQGVPKPAERPTPQQPPDLAAIQAYAGPGTTPKAPLITWVGHATMLVQAGGLNVLTDPVFSERASPFQFIGPQRAQPPGIALADLPPIDVVLISHNHYDHLDKAAVQEIARRSKAAGRSTRFLVPLGLKAWFADLGIEDAVELDWWDRHVVRGVEFNFTPVQHWSARGLGDRSQTLWGGYAVFAPDFHWYFSGDTGYSKDFADTAARFAGRQTAAQGGGFDLALIAVGAYEPRWFMKEQHVNPAEAVQIHRDLHAKRSVGVHWGTFELTDEPLDQPPRELAAARGVQGLSEQDFSVMAVGETRALPGRAAP
ncbi:MAG: fold metallo-hydrolase [Polaromonas sp.]|nr:fold metallo-hydrolase [Polaromonas sp.]